MRCYTQRQLAASNEYIQIGSDMSYNVLINVLMWNLEFTAIIMVSCLVIWNKFNIPWLGRLTRGLRRTEDVVMVGGHVRLISGEKQNTINVASWHEDLKKWFFFDKEYLVKWLGDTGYEYLTFQRYIIAYQVVLTVVSLGIVLPIHLTIGDRFELSQFAATTMSNIGPSNLNLTYIHVTGSFLLLPMAMVTMRMFFRKIAKVYVGHEYMERRTIYLTGLPKSLRSHAAIEKYMQRRYPGCNIESIKVNVKLVSICRLEAKLNMLEDTILEAEKSGGNERLFRRCRLFAWMLRPPVLPPRSVDYYRDQKVNVELAIRHEAEHILRKDRKLDSAFVRMELFEDASQIVFLHNYTLGRRAFDMTLAPEPSDVLWPQMDIRTNQFFKKLISDAFFAVTLIFALTSGNLIDFIELKLSHDSEPSVLTKLLNRHPWFRAVFHLAFAEVWAQLIAVILDFGYWTSSRKSIGDFQRMYFLLLTALYFIPLLNIDSFFDLATAIVNKEVETSCILLPDSGVFYINSMMVMALFTSSIELLRWKTLIHHAWIAVTSKSWSEMNIRCINSAYELFGLTGNVADVLLNFTITNCMAFVSPVVVPFGLAYTVIKHCVDSYTLITGAFKLQYLNTRFYVEVCHMMALSSLLPQGSIILSLLLSPYVTFLTFGSATTLGLGFTFLSCVIINQQVQSDQSWPFRVLPDMIEEPAQASGTPEEPTYESPLATWLNLGRRRRLSSF